MKVTPKQSKQVQELCFRNGFKWKDGTTAIKHTKEKCLFLQNGEITYLNSHLKSFEDKNIEEITPEEFLKKYGKPVKVGDIIVSKDGNFTAKVLDVLYNSFLVSFWGNYHKAAAFCTFDEIKLNGWKIKKEDTLPEYTIEELTEKVGHEFKIKK